MSRTIIKCESCGEIILKPYDPAKAQKCPGCGRMTALNIVDLSDRPDVLRRLKSVLEREAENRKRIKF